SHSFRQHLPQHMVPLSVTTSSLSARTTAATAKTTTRPSITLTAFIANLPFGCPSGNGVGPIGRPAPPCCIADEYNREHPVWQCSRRQNYATYSSLRAAAPLTGSAAALECSFRWQEEILTPLRDRDIGDDGRHPQGRDPDRGAELHPPVS